MLMKVGRREGDMEAWHAIIWSPALYKLIVIVAKFIIILFFRMDKLHMALTELCYAINYCSQIQVWEYTFAPREYLYQHLEQRYDHYILWGPLIMCILYKYLHLGYVFYLGKNFSYKWYIQHPTSLFQILGTNPVVVFFGEVAGFHWCLLSHNFRSGNSQSTASLWILRVPDILT